MKKIIDLIYKCAHWYVDDQKNFWLRNFIGFLFFGLPFFILHLCTNAGLREFLKNNSDNHVALFFDNHFWIIYLIMAFISFMETKIYTLANYLDKKSIFSDVKVASFNVVWEQLVNSKCFRFDTFLTSKNYKAGMSKEEIFNNITRPDQQFITLAKVLYEYFHSQFDHEFKVRILKIKNKEPCKWLSFHPSKPETEATKLKDPKSTVSNCIRKNKMLIIEDIAEEIKKENAHYFVTHNIRDEKGSLVCIPCYCEKIKDYATVVIIWCEEKMFFKERERKKIQSITEQIESRVKLEQNLLILTE